MVTRWTRTAAGAWASGVRFPHFPPTTSASAIRAPSVLICEFRKDRMFPLWHPRGKTAASTIEGGSGVRNDRKKGGEYSCVDMGLQRQTRQLFISDPLPLIVGEIPPRSRIDRKYKIAVIARCMPGAGKATRVEWPDFRLRSTDVETSPISS